MIDGPEQLAGSRPDDLDGGDLAARRDRFVALWSRMGAQWGIPRTMAQVHALLYIHGVPMTADEVVQHLGISRGNASMTLRGLLDWGLVHRVHVPGERRERFEAEQDVWKLLQTVVAARKKREIDPLLHELAACRESEADSVHAEAEDDRRSQITAHNTRIEAMQQLVSLIDSIGDHLVQTDVQTLRDAVRMLEQRS